MRRARRSFSTRRGTWQPCLSLSWAFRPCSEPKCWRQEGAPWTQPLGRGVQPQHPRTAVPVLRADGFLTSTPLSPLSVVRLVAATPCVSHRGCETKPNPTAWTAPRHDHTRATPSPSASARTGSASILRRAMGSRGLWPPRGCGCRRVRELCGQSLASGLLEEAGGEGTAGAGHRPCCPQNGTDLCGGRVQAGLQPLPQSERHIHIPVAFFWHLSPSLEVAELQEGRVKRETDLTCRVSAASAVSEEFSSYPE